jgi:hypothetical protein
MLPPVLPPSRSINHVSWSPTVSHAVGRHTLGGCQWHHPRPLSTEARASAACCTSGPLLPAASVPAAPLCHCCLLPLSPLHLNPHDCHLQGCSICIFPTSRPVATLLLHALLPLLAAALLKIVHYPHQCERQSTLALKPATRGY